MRAPNRLFAAMLKIVAIPKDLHGAQLHEIFPKLKSSRSVGPPYFNKLLDKDGQKCVRKRTFQIRTKRD